MPIEISRAQPSVIIRRQAFERAGLTRADLDARHALTEDEFRVERDLIVVGPLLGDSAAMLLAELEERGLEYFEDYFDLSGNWPDWLRLFGMGGT